MLSNTNTCYPTRINVIQHKYVLSKVKNVLSNATNFLLNVITCYPIQLFKNTLFKARTFYSTQKRVNRCKNRVFQCEKVLSNARNVLYNARNVIFDKKNLLRKIVITKKMIWVITTLKYRYSFCIFGTFFPFCRYLF